MAATQLTHALSAMGSGWLVVVTGAGISLASGIPTFRGSDPDAVWAKDLTELATLDYFRREPVHSWQWYLEHFSHVLDKQPNAAHHALVGLERWHGERGGRFTLITQNVDPLHERAGARHLIKVHGSADRVRCTRYGCELGPPAGSLASDEAGLQEFLHAPSEHTLPRCPRCRSLLRPHVLWFDEYYEDHDDYQWGGVVEAARGADLYLFVGTSFAVGVTSLFTEAAIRRGSVALSIDPGVDESPHPAIDALREKAEVLLPEVVSSLPR